MKFAIARYYFDSLFRNEASTNFVNDLRNSRPHEERTFNYAVGNIEVEEYNDKKLVRGVLGRIRRDGQSVDQYHEDAHEFTTRSIRDIADQKVEFVVLPDYHLIFIEKNSIINPRYFAGKLEKIYDSSSTTAGNFSVDFIVVQADFYRYIQGWDYVTRATFTKLHPTNPSTLDDFEELEELLEETNSENTKLDFKVKQNSQQSSDAGLNHESKLIHQAMALTAHGYGEADFKGKKNNEDVEVSSKKFIRTEDIDFQSEEAHDDIINIADDIQQNG